VLSRHLPGRPRRRGHQHHRTHGLAAADAIAAAVPDGELAPSYVVPSVFNKRVVELVAAAVAEAAKADGVCRR
jgi:malate dehydrogenase (oxaloacetate-decarboxylating)